MHVLICGAGRVGQGIARRLAREKHEITIIDENADLVDQVSIDLDVRGIVGHAAHPDVLKRARAADCEMIIAVTHFDEINMVICQIAHTIFSVPFKIARVQWASAIVSIANAAFDTESGIGETDKLLDMQTFMRSVSFYTPKESSDYDTFETSGEVSKQLPKGVDLKQV